MDKKSMDQNTIKLRITSLENFYLIFQAKGLWHILRIIFLKELFKALKEKLVNYFLVYKHLKGHLLMIRFLKAL